MAVPARLLAPWEVGDVTGAVVAVDVLRAFTTAAYAFGAGAREIVLVDSVEEALRYRATHDGVLAMGEDGGHKPAGFDFSNSPTAISAADLEGRVIVHRSTAGTRGAVAARRADRLWCASLVCASATAAAVTASGLGAPAYVVTGRTRSRPDETGDDDEVAARLIERARLGQPLDRETTVHAVATSAEAARTLALGAADADPHDITLATRIDAFDFAMEVDRSGGHLRLRARARGSSEPA